MCALFVYIFAVLLFIYFFNFLLFEYQINKSKNTTNWFKTKHFDLKIIFQIVYVYAYCSICKFYFLILFVLFLKIYIFQLQAVDMEEKLNGIQTLEAMGCDLNAANKIANSEVVKTLGPLLIDASDLVRAAAASAFRTIADNGGEETVANLLKNDIITPLAALLKRVKNSAYFFLLYFFVFFQCLFFYKNLLSKIFKTTKHKEQKYSLINTFKSKYSNCQIYNLI